MARLSPGRYTALRVTSSQVGFGAEDARYRVPPSGAGPAQPRLRSPGPPSWGERKAKGGEFGGVRWSLLLPTLATAHPARGWMGRCGHQYQGPRGVWQDHPEPGQPGLRWGEDAALAHPAAPATGRRAHSQDRAAPARPYSWGPPHPAALRGLLHQAGPQEQTVPQSVHLWVAMEV